MMGVGDLGWGSDCGGIFYMVEGDRRRMFGFLSILGIDVVVIYY